MRSLIRRLVLLVATCLSLAVIQVPQASAVWADMSCSALAPINVTNVVMKTCIFRDGELRPDGSGLYGVRVQLLDSSHMTRMVNHWTIQLYKRPAYFPGMLIWIGSQSCSGVVNQGNLWCYSLLANVVGPSSISGITAVASVRYNSEPQYDQWVNHWL